jgi:hypothetical protein
MVGMSSQIEHHSTNAELARLEEEEGLNIQLARDGLSIDVDLSE